MQESRLERERKNSHTFGFVEGLECTKNIILRDLRNAIDNEDIIISKGKKELFEIIERVGRVGKSEC